MYIECPQDRAITPEFQKKCIQNYPAKKLLQ